MEMSNEALLDGIDILIFVHDHATYPLGETTTKPGVGVEFADGQVEQRGEVEISVIVHLLAIPRKANLRDRTSAKMPGNDLILAQGAQSRRVPVGVDVPAKPAPIGGRTLGQARLLAVPVYVQFLSHCVERLMLEILGNLALEQFLAKPVDRSDVHLRRSHQHPAEDLLGPKQNAVLQFRRRLVGEGERNNVRGPQTISSPGKQVCHPASDDLGLAGPSTSDQLKVVGGGADGLLL